MAPLVRVRLVILGAAWILLLSASVYGYSVVSGPNRFSAANSQYLTLNAAGTTLAYPLLSLVAGRYTETHPNVLINYQAEGSVFGIREFTAKRIDFAATYPPLNRNQRKAAPNALHIPESISAVAVSYNLQGVSSGLNLTGALIAEIFLYNITRWDDPAIRQLNPNTSLPDKTIITVHNAEPEGTTFVFTTFLSITSSDWQTHVGNGTDVAWPGYGASTPTDAGVSSLVKSTPNSIGYMELSYAIQAGLTYASILNRGGHYVEPSAQTASAAAEHLNNTLPAGDGDWSRINLLDEPGPSSYPLVTFTYLLAYKELNVVPSMDQQKAKALADFFWFDVHDGQSLGTSLGYVPIPQRVVDINEQSLKSITFDGQTLYP